MCTIWRNEMLVAMGSWRRDNAVNFQHLAELIKVMVHPQARGIRLGRIVTGALIGSALSAGIETLHLGSAATTIWRSNCMRNSASASGGDCPTSSRTVTSASMMSGCFLS